MEFFKKFRVYGKVAAILFITSSALVFPFHADASDEPELCCLLEPCTHMEQDNCNTLVHVSGSGQSGYQCEWVSSGCQQSTTQVSCRRCVEE